MTQEEMYEYLKNKIIVLNEITKVEQREKEAKNDEILSHRIKKEKEDLLFLLYKMEEEYKDKTKLKENSLIPDDTIIGFTHDSKTFTTYYYDGEKEEVPCTEYRTYNIAKFTMAFKQMQKFVKENASVRKDQIMLERWKELVPYMEQMEEKGTFSYGYLIQNFDLLKVNTASDGEYDAYLKEFQEGMEKHHEKELCFKK